MTDPVRAQVIINGEWRSANSGQELDVLNPANPDELVGTVALANQTDVADAIEAAHAAFPAWASLSFSERASYLTRVAANLNRDRDELTSRVRLFTREHGKILSESNIEFTRFRDRFEWCASQARTLAEETAFKGPPRDTLLTHQPRGVTCLIAPWNWPLAILGGKLPHALMAGNTVVVKLAEQSPLAPMLTLRLVAEALPPGVVNVIASPVSTIGDSLIEHSLVRKICFTGSTAAGKHIMRVAAEGVKSVTLELGGNDPALILEDAELDDEAVARLANATFMTSGQICMAVKRIYVHKTRYEELLDKFVKQVDRHVVGDGLNEQVSMGPLNNSAQHGIVTELIDDARNNGATVQELGTVDDESTFSQGYFRRPTVVTDCAVDARVVQEEQFGPVIPILSVDSVEEAVARANHSEFGLCSSVWSANVADAARLAMKLEAGYTYINGHGPMAQDHRSPFGGVKQSGIGRVFGVTGIREFMEPHSIAAPQGSLFGD